jgi:hypothetical protein
MRHTQAHVRAEKLVATWPGAHRFLLTSPQRIAAVKEVEMFLLGATDGFGTAAHLLLELSSSAPRTTKGLAVFQD